MTTWKKIKLDSYFAPNAKIKYKSQLQTDYEKQNFKLLKGKKYKNIFMTSRQRRISFKKPLQIATIKEKINIVNHIRIKNV